MRIEKPRMPAWLAEDFSILALILCVALALRIVIALSFQLPTDVTTLPELRVFEQIALRGHWDAVRPPLYPLFLRLAFVVFGDSNFKAVAVIQGILSIVVVGCLFIAGRLLHGRGAGITAAAIAALYPNFITCNLVVLPFAIGLVFVALIIATALIEMSEKRRAGLLAVFAGIGILFQPLLAYLVPGMLLTVKKRLLFLAVLAAILAPWTIRNSIIEGTLVPVYRAETYKVDVMRNKNLYESWGSVHNLYFNASAVFKKGWRPAKVGGKKELRNSNYVATYGYVVVMILGFTGLIRSCRREHLAVVAPVAGYIVLLVVLTDFKIRYRLYLEPLLIFYTAVLLNDAARRLLRLQKPA